MKIYKLYRIIERDGEEYAAKLGVYSSEHEAHLAKKRAAEFWSGAQQQGRIEVYFSELDHISWTSGFGE
jgi:hypothetical protein